MKRIIGGLLAVAALLPFGRAASADPVNMIFDIIGPSRSGAMINALEPWADKINQQGAGLIHLDVREGVTLANFENIYDRVLDDAIQVGWGMQNAVAGKFPLSEVPAVMATLCRNWVPKSILELLSPRCRSPRSLL